MKSNNQSIFQRYTGNAFLNQALFTVEYLAKLENPAQINSEILEALFRNPLMNYRKQSKPQGLTELNLRLKSYTMVFSKNGPLHNKGKAGPGIYSELMVRLLKESKNFGKYQCSITGLCFDNPFSKIYSEVLRDINQRIGDTTVHRCWWPLIGSLGSDAQALPQARFAYSIHPICLFLIQFLPLSTMLFQGKALVVDASSISFSRNYVFKILEQLRERESFTGSKKKIENVSLTTGNCILNALELLDDNKQKLAQGLGISFWYYLNSGKDPSFDVYNIPDELLHKLFLFYEDSETSAQLADILHSKQASFFIEALDRGQDWYGLYPSKTNSGVSLAFFVKYKELIGEKSHIDLCRRAACLINDYVKRAGADENKTTTDSTVTSTEVTYEEDLSDRNHSNIIFEVSDEDGESVTEYRGSDIVSSRNDLFRPNSSELKLLQKSDAWNDKDYSTLLLRSLINGARQGRWDCARHIRLLDRPDDIPARYYMYNHYKMIHFFYIKGAADINPGLSFLDTNLTRYLVYFIDVINADVRRAEIVSALTNTQGKGRTAPILGALIRSAHRISYADIYPALYRRYTAQRHLEGWFTLLRVFYSQKESISLPALSIAEWESNELVAEERLHYQKYVTFAIAYLIHLSIRNKPIDRFLANYFPSIKAFRHWLLEVIESMHRYRKDITAAINNYATLLHVAADLMTLDEQLHNTDEYVENLMVNIEGVPDMRAAHFAIQYNLNHVYYSNRNAFDNKLNKDETA